ncbi:DNA-binding protein [uncultured Brevundimonas sp.]|uniref:DNA-binding protein n=1 Tax=uncultured Brevundimonas sp. TaxID=213418 RepID=UPI0030EF3981|tara:strand:- start:3626 stop:3949 length:324 start_codon:yes stop_codon:yes gene_type:complete
MTGNTRISGRLITAARGLAGVSATDFANAAGLSLDSLDLAERGGSAFIQSQSDAAALKRGLEHFGIVIIEEGDGFGAGVRLKFTRQDVRQIVRLEGEGGKVGSDDAP